MTPWSEVLTAALIGTDRRPTTTPDALLDEAATWAPFRRAGLRPATGARPPAPAPAETRPVVRPGASRRLARLLEPGSGLGDAATKALVLAEWLELAAGRGWRVAAHQLPALLDAGRQRRDLRPLVAGVGGERARWLAAQNDAWRYLLSEEATPDERLWAEGSAGERLGYLRALRRADPAAAGQRLADEWPRLTTEERAQFLPVLAHALADADEAVLERALDERRAQTRAAAVALLTLLPHSAHQARCAQRARACQRYDGTLEPPRECDPAMRRDGVEPRPPKGVGERAWWLEEVVALAPLSVWPAGMVHRGLARAAAAHRDPTWADRVLDTLADSPADRALAATLYPVLAPDRLVTRAQAAVADNGSRGIWAPMLAACPAPWPTPLGAAVLDGLATLATAPAMAGETLQLSRLAAVRLPVGLSARASLIAAERPRLHDLAQVLAFRFQLTEELQP